MPGYDSTPALRLSSSSTSLPRPIHDCIVVGAGPAGISTARTLRSLAPHSSVLLLEGRSRIGGRTQTSTALGVPVDLGGSWIHHYGPSNPLVPLAQEVTARRLGLTEEKARMEAHSAAGQTGGAGCPFPGLGGGEGRFLLFDHDGSRISKAVYSSALSIYHRCQKQADGKLQAVRKTLPQRPSHREVLTPVHYSSHLAEEYTQYSAAVKEVDCSLGSVLMSLAEEEVSVQPMSERPRLRRVLNFLLSGGEQCDGVSMEGRSALSWYADVDGEETAEYDCLVQRGYGEVIAQLGQGLDIRLRHVVRHVDYGSTDLVRIHVEVEDEQERVVRREQFECRHVVVTLPLGVLKSEGAVTWTPALPAEKRDAIESFGFGLMNKIVLQFERCWWGDEVISLGHCSERRGLYRWILSLQPALLLNRAVLAQHPQHGYGEAETRGSVHVLVCFSTATMGKEVEAKADEQQRDEVMAMLRACYTRTDSNAAAPAISPTSSAQWRSAESIWGSDEELLYTGALPEVDAVPDPIGCIVTKWGADRFSYGSYSHYTVGTHQLTIDMLAASIDEGRVGFAGEHTNRSWGCVDSAWATGIREGQRVAEMLKESAAVSSPEHTHANTYLHMA